MRELPEAFWSRVLEVRDVLAFSFDFEAFDRPLGPEAYATPSPWHPAFVVPGAMVSVVGRDAMDGAYVRCERDRQSCCLHIDPRGNAACLGDDVRQALALIVALPYWRELLAQYPSGEYPSGECLSGECPSGDLGPSGDLAVMRARALPLERQACEDLFELPAARRELQAFLELPELADPIRRLHELAVAESPPVTVWSPHGWRYESPLRGSGHRVVMR